MPALKTKKGRLTAYALACGYVEYRKTENVTTQFYSQHGVYFVRQFKDGVKTTWKGFPSFGVAKKFFDQQPGELYEH